MFEGDTLWVWRHPRPVGIEGRCIGQCDVIVPARRAKRLARRVQMLARRHGLPRVVYTSPLQRCAAVGRYLRRWGWQHVRDPALLELSFGAWDGQRWSDINHQEIDQWCQDFASHRPGAGESLQAMLARASAWQASHGEGVVIGHAGWMLSRRWAREQGAAPTVASQWPQPPAYAALWHLC